MGFRQAWLAIRRRRALIVVWKFRARWILAAGVSLACAAAIAILGYRQWSRPRPAGPLEVYRGITYVCEEHAEPECDGLVFVVQVDLNAPGIGLYLTPLDREAVAQGYQYRLADAKAVLRREGLAVAVNGAFFVAKSGLFYQAGDLANGVQTVIADGQVSHVDPHSYMLWFEPDLTPHIETEKPPSESVLRAARWGIGGGAVELLKGQVNPGAANHAMNRRTAVGIDSGHRLLWLAVFENASSLAVARILAQHGAQDGFLLDGGHSTVMVLGPKAAKVEPGTVFGGARPVATVLGIRADPL
jgi:hypothetical protein